MKRQVPWIIGLSFVLMVSGISASVFYSSQKTVPSNALSTQNIDTTIENDAEVNAYYFTVGGLSGSALQSGLYDIIKTSTSMTYEEAAYAMKITDRDWNLSPVSAHDSANYDLATATSDDPYMYLLYGQYNGSTETAYKWSADHTYTWNKEHTWAKSHGNFLENAPAGTDLHHLRAADQSNNDYHSNYDFGNADNTTVTPSFDYSAINCPDERGNISGKQGYSSRYTSDKVFEPRDEDKGDVARMIFYMATRYYAYLSQGAPKLEIIEGLSGSAAMTASALITGKMGILSDLLTWNTLDPVSSFEIRRNNLIDHNFQENRNPYIDHPEWVNAVYDTTYTGPTASVQAGSSSVGSYPTVTLTGLTLDTTSVTTFYLQDTAYSNNGLIVLASYSDGTSKPVSSYVTTPAAGSILSTLGTQPIDVSYTEGATTVHGNYSVEVGTTTPVLQSLSLNTSTAKTTFSIGESFSSSGLVVVGVYNTGNSIIADGSYTLSTPDLYSLGKRTVTVSYGGKSASYDILVTNAEALVGEGTMPTDPTWAVTTTSSTSFGASTTIPLSSNIFSGIKWNFSFTWVNTPSFSTNNTRGSQIGSATHPVKTFSMETDSAFEFNHNPEILKIAVDTSGAVNTNGVLKVYVGDTQVGTNYNLLVNTTGYNIVPFVSPTRLSGKVRLEFSQTAAVAIYLHGVSIFGATLLGGVTPKQQASAFASYVLALPACTMTDEDVITMMSEYDYMTAESKVFFNAMTNGATLGKDRYDYILNLHPNAVSLSDGEFIPLEDVSASNAPIWMIFVILPFAVMAATGVFIFIRRKHLLK